MEDGVCISQSYIKSLAYRLHFEMWICINHSMYIKKKPYFEVRFLCVEQ